MGVPKALTIAGSDSGGGAGIQADLKTFSAFRVFGMSVITAVTAQNSLGVQGVFNLPPEFVSRQLDSVLSDFGADAIKIGMLSTAPIIGAVAERLRADAREKIVLDPVMIAKSGDALLQPEARTALMKELLPLALVVTPNLHEAAALAGIPVATESDMEEAARRILALGPRNVLVKGGHLRDSATDILWNGRDFARFTAPRLASTSTHGTGCTLSSAIAACLARGHVLKDAVSEAKAYVTAASQYIVDWLARPVTRLNYSLVFTAPAEAFWVQMKVGLIVGIFLSAPAILWQVWAFIAPGLHTHEKKYALPFVIIGSLLFIGGGAFSLFVVTPYAIQFLLSYARPGLTPMITLQNHVDFLLKFTLAFGAVFELPLALTILARVGVVNAKMLARNRKYAILGAFVAGAVLTPTPDAFNQTLMAGPLILLYEVGIICARIFGRKPAPAPEPAPAESA